MPEEADDDGPRPQPEAFGPAARPPQWRRPTTLIAYAAAAAAVVAISVFVVTASPSGGPRYARPYNPCKLVTVATLDKYLGGAPPGSQGPVWAKNPQGRPTTVDCGWSNEWTGAQLFLFANIYHDAKYAELGFQGTARVDERSTTAAGEQMKVTGTQQVAGLGDAAAAAFTITTTPSFGSLGTSHLVNLTVWSGNAEIGIQITYGNPGYPQPRPQSMPSRSTQLAAAVAAARDVLAALPRA